MKSDGLSGGWGRWRKGLWYLGYTRTAHIAWAVVTSKKKVKDPSRSEKVKKDGLPSFVRT